MQPGTIASVHHIWTAADPLDHEHAGTGSRPQLKSQSLADFMMLCASRRRARNDGLQISEPEEACLDMVLDAAECRVDDGPQRLHKELLQSAAHGVRPSDRWRRRSRSVRPQGALP